MVGVEPDGDGVVRVSADGQDGVADVGERGGAVCGRKGYEDAVDVQQQVGQSHWCLRGQRLRAVIRRVVGHGSRCGWWRSSPEVMRRSVRER